MAPPSDAEFEDFYRRHVRLARAVLRGFPDLDGSREDVLQDVFISAYNSWRSLPDDPPGAWIIVATRNKAIDYLRRSRASPVTSIETSYELADRLSSHEPSPLARLVIGETIDRALGKLTAEHREVVLLRHYEGLDVKETAEFLGVPQGTVKSRLKRALDIMAADLRSMVPDGYVPSAAHYTSAGRA